MLLCLNFKAHAQQQFKWVKGGGTTDAIPSGRDDESVYYMCTDPNGNVYSLSVVGADPIKADTFSHSACGYHTNILLTSYRCDGTMRWAKLINGSGINEPEGIVADNTGHIYVSGLFDHASGSHYFNIGYDTSIVGYYYLAEGLIQLDTNGSYKWVRFIGTNTLASYTASSTVYAPLALDGANNIHQFPYVKAGVPFLTGVTSKNGIYDLTYDPSGTLLSAIPLSADTTWYIHEALIDPLTNKLYVCGEKDFGLGFPDTSFVAAFDASRNLLWRKHSGNPGKDGISGITMDQSKNLYFSGGANGTPFSFNGVSVAAGEISVITKIDTNGTVNWMRRFGCTLAVNALQGITSLPNNKVAAVGGFAGKITNDAGTYTFVTPAGEGQNAYMVIVDSAGDVQYMDQIHGNGFYDWGYAITSDKRGNIYFGGEVEDSIWAGTPKIPAYHSMGGNTDFFVMKYGVDCSCTSMPVSAFAYSGTHTLSVSYTGTGTGIDSIVWNFGDGSATVKGLTAIHTYTLAGTYRVTATVYTPCGNDIHGENVVIKCGLPPTAAFTNSGFHTLSFTYTGTTSTVDSTVWNFGDGSSTAKGSTTSHTYAAVGVYTVCVTAWSVCGNNTACKTVTVTCVSAPTSAFTSSGVSTIATTYTGTTTALDSVVWNFGDGSPTVKGSTATHTYAAIGTFTICATAYSACGSNTACNSVTIPCIAVPTASFTDTGHITVGATYTGTTTAIDSIVWKFGDGSPSVKGSTAIHTYTAVGIYNICVTAYNPCGNHTYCYNDTVRCITAPVASFSDTSTNKNSSFTYKGTTAGIDSIVWDFGDGTKDTGIKPVHIYSVYGTYRVCATIYTPCGVDSSCNMINIHRVGVADPELTDIRVFPNPANDALTITGIIESTSYRLLSVTGICIDRGIFHQGSNTLSLRLCVPGIYLLEMTAQNGERTNVRVVKE